jgi:hypothetical protein
MGTPPVPAMTVVNRLKPEDCPLLPPDKVDGLCCLFNKRVELLQVFREAFGPEFFEDETLAGQIRKLNGIRLELMRERYSIGFVGTTQVGKSTAINRVLEASRDQDGTLCVEGAGGNTTSTMCRIRHGSRSLHLVYMTEEQYQQKLKFLCDQCQLELSSTENIGRTTGFARLRRFW